VRYIYGSIVTEAEADQTGAMRMVPTVTRQNCDVASVFYRFSVVRWTPASNQRTARSSSVVARPSLSDN